MDIYVVTTFHFSQTPASISYHASEREPELPAERLRQLLSARTAARVRVP